MTDRYDEIAEGLIQQYLSAGSEKQHIKACADALRAAHQRGRDDTIAYHEKRAAEWRRDHNSGWGGHTFEYGQMRAQLHEHCADEIRKGEATP